MSAEQTGGVLVYYKHTFSFVLLILQLCSFLLSDVSDLLLNDGRARAHTDQVQART